MVGLGIDGSYGTPGSSESPRVGRLPCDQPVHRAARQAGSSTTAVP